MNKSALADVLLTVVATCAIGLSVVTSLSGPANAEEPERVFTTVQATTGKAEFEKSCAVCHMRDLSGDADAPQLAGTQFLSSWRTRSIRDLFQYLSTAMPPGSSPLTADAYAAVTAYILQSNGAVAGPNVLTPATAASIGSVAGKNVR